MPSANATSAPHVPTVFAALQEMLASYTRPYWYDPSEIVEDTYKMRRRCT